MVFVDEHSSVEGVDIEKQPRLIEQAIPACLDKLSLAMATSLICSLKSHKAKYGDVIQHGSMCSGCDIMTKMMEVLMQVFTDKYDVTFITDNLYQVEMNEEKRNFLARHVPSICSFGWQAR